MDAFINGCKVFFAMIGGWIGYFFGDIDGLVMTLLIFIAVDYATGVFCAMVERNISSAIGFKGLAKKAFILLVVGVAHLLDVRFQHGDVLRGAVCLFYLANEGFSILENGNRLGVPLPKGLKKIFATMKETSEETIDKIEEKEGVNDGDKNNV